MCNSSVTTYPPWVCDDRYLVIGIGDGDSDDCRGLLTCRVTCNDHEDILRDRLPVYRRRVQESELVLLRGETKDLLNGSVRNPQVELACGTRDTSVGPEPEAYKYVFYNSTG